MPILSSAERTYLEHKAYNLRKLSLEATTAAGSGHPTSALSAADIVSALFFHTMKLDFTDPHNPDNDRFILSKGHAIPVVYAAWQQAGVVSEEQLMTLRTFDSVLEGHPTPRFVYNEAATGSLGMGLSIGLGMALSARLENRSFYTYVMMGDSEMAEGSIWESCELAAYYKASNLVAIIDVNRLGQSTQTMEGWNTEDYKNKFIAFGWNAWVIDGHDLEQIVEALQKTSQKSDKPSVIIAKTIKGYGLTSIENHNGYHGRAFSKQELPEKLNELYQRFKKTAASKPENIQLVTTHLTNIEHAPCKLLQSPYKLDEKIATRKVFGYALVDLGKQCKKIVSLDGEVKNSTFAEIFEKAYPERFIQSFIAEQNMVGMAIGYVLRGYIPFTSTFGAFFTRAHDQIRMASIGRAALRLVGSHCGVSIGEDGPSQMALEDIAMMRSIAGSIVLYPCDGTSAYKLMEIMANYHAGISYLRTTREATPVVYSAEEKFVLGGSKIIKESDHDQVLVVAAGITVHEALEAFDLLKKEGIMIAIVDAYSIKPLDGETIVRVAKKSMCRIITVEDHYIEGGLGETVCRTLINDAFKVHNLAVKKISRSGTPEKLLAYHEIDAAAIVRSVKQIIKLSNTFDQNKDACD